MVIVYVSREGASFVGIHTAMHRSRTLAFIVCLPLIHFAMAQVTIADAGPDQYLCDDNAFLQGNPVASGETGSWSIVSGVGNLNDLSDPGSQITGPASSVIVLRWTISEARSRYWPVP